MAEQTGQNVNLGYASFVHFINQSEYGYTAAISGNWYLMIYKGKNGHLFSLSVDKKCFESKNIYTNTGTLRKLFIEYPDLIQKLLSFCIKSKDDHCHIDPSLWGMIETTIETGKIGKTETVKCLHPPLT